MSEMHKLLFVGDMVLQSKPEFSYELQALFRQAKIKSCNIEAPLAGLGNAVKKTGPLVAQIQEAPKFIQDLGFNLFSLANNHIADYGEKALLETKSKFPKDRVIGVGNEDEAYSLTIITINTVRYGFVAYGENGYGALNGENSVGYAWINHPRVNNNISEFKKQVDFLIVQVHAGVEMLDVPIPEWRSRYYELIDCGADVIIAHHPHLVQGIEEYKDKLICYSLGNFYFDYSSTHPEWNVGGLLELYLQKDSKPTYKMHLVSKIDQTICLWDKNEASNKMENLNNKLSNPDYEDYVNKKAVELWKNSHKAYYAKPLNGFSNYSIVGILKYIKRLFFNSKTDYNMLWHNFFIESNFWLVKRAIQQLKQSSDSHTN